MHPFSTKKTYFYAYLLTFALTFSTALLFSTVFTHIPLSLHSLPIFANFSLGLAVFSSSFYLGRKTPFFQFTSIFLFSAVILCTVILCTALFGELHADLLIQKTILIIAAAFLGEICGRA